MRTSLITSTIVNAPIERVWQVVGDFNGLPRWHPIVVDSHIEPGATSGSIGCVRNYGRHDGLRLREKLTGLDPERYTCTYILLEPPFAVADYAASIRLSRVTLPESTYVRWEAWFECSEADERALVDGVTGVFNDGLLALRREFSH